MVKSIGRIRRPAIWYAHLVRGRDFMWLCGKVWQAGTARRGCVIHHLDWNKTHNVIENLVCVTVSEHNLIHNPPAGSAVGGREYGYEIKRARGLDVPPGL